MFVSEHDDVLSSANKSESKSSEMSGQSLTVTENALGPIKDPWGTPVSTVSLSDDFPLTTVTCSSLSTDVDFQSRHI